MTTAARIDEQRIVKCLFFTFPSNRLHKFSNRVFRPCCTTWIDTPNKILDTACFLQLHIVWLTLTYSVNNMKVITIEQVWQDWPSPIAYIFSNALTMLSVRVWMSKIWRHLLRESLRTQILNQNQVTTSKRSHRKTGLWRVKSKSKICLWCTTRADQKSWQIWIGQWRRAKRLVSLVEQVPVCIIFI